LSALFGADADPGEGRAAVAGVRGYFAYLAAAATIPLQCDSGAQMILEYAMRRQELLGYAELAAAVHVKDTPGESDKRRRQAAEHMELHQDVSVASRRSDWDAAELTADLMATLRAGEKPKAFYCGSHSLQAVLGGFDPGGLYILAGRPGMGKSACASSWSVRMAKAGHGVMRFDLEMTAQQQRNRMVTDWAYSGHRDVSYFDLGRNDVDPGRLYAIEDAAKFIGSLPMHFSDRAAPTLQTIRMKLQDRQARAAAKGHRIDIVVVDHLGLMRPMVKAERRDLDVGELTAGLKSLAKDMGVAVLALHQLSRPAKGSEAARPTLESLRDSGRVEEDADVVMLLYREHYFEVRKTQRDVEKMLELEHKLEVDVAKNRGGRTTKLEMFCDMATSRISDIAR
jgi:replicative DNA helicase